MQPTTNNQQPIAFTENFGIQNVGNDNNAQAVNGDRVEEQRVEVSLPHQYREQFQGLGIELSESNNPRQFLVSAKLPQGWTVRENLTSYSDYVDFVLIDDSGAPRVTLWLKTSPYNQFARVSVLSPEKSAELAKKYESESKLDKEFQVLIKEYQQVLEYTAGGGHRFQSEIDRVWKKLQDFAVEHPEFEEKVPARQISYADGSGGINTGLGMAVSNGDCSVM